MSEQPKPLPDRPTKLSAEDQITAMTVLNWCANNLVSIPRNSPATTTSTLLVTKTQGSFGWDQLIRETIPHKIGFKWMRKYGTDIKKEVDGLYDSNITIHLHKLYEYSKTKSENFKKLI